MKPEKVKVLVTELCPTLCIPMDYTPPGSSVHGILQARIRGLPFPSPRDLPNPGIKCRSPALQSDSLPSELPEKLDSSTCVTSVFPTILRSRLHSQNCGEN